jgi:hypothetical protein
MSVTTTAACLFFKKRARAIHVLPRPTTTIFFPARCISYKLTLIVDSVRYSNPTASLLLAGGQGLSKSGGGRRLASSVQRYNVQGCMFAFFQLLLSWFSGESQN